MTDARAGASGRDHDSPGEAGDIRVHLDELLRERSMTLTELAALVDVTVVNLSILKNGRARAIRFATMARLCEALSCQPGDLLSYEPRAKGAGRTRALHGLDNRISDITDA